MSRPKGSTNKKKPFVVPPKTIIVDNPVENVDNNVPRGDFECRTVCVCGHEQELHYGGNKGNCNRMNCPCLEYK